MRNIVWSCPELVVFCAYRYLAANWTVKTRVERVMQHCQIVEEIGWPLNVAPGKVREILRCSLVGPNYRITLDQARWLVAEGLIVISLLDGPDRLFSISANLAYLDGERVIFIGGLQGEARLDSLDRYRSFTKLAFGMRPRDFLIEILKMLCRRVGVSRMYAVTAENHSSRSKFVSAREADWTLDYDEIWRERGGILSSQAGFFEFPVSAHRKMLTDIPQKKRSMYRQRYAMMHEFEKDILHKNYNEVRPPSAIGGRATTSQLNGSSVSPPANDSSASPPA